MVPPSPTSRVAAVARGVFVLSLAVGVLLTAVVVWGIVEVRGQQATQDTDTTLAAGQGVVSMHAGHERRISVDGPSLPEARCTVTAPDGQVQTIEGFEPVGQPRLGKQGLGKWRAETSGDYQVRCTGVQQAWVGSEYDPLRRSLLTIPAVAGAFLVVGVLPVAAVSLIVWRVSRTRGTRRSYPQR